MDQEHPKTKMFKTSGQLRQILKQRERLKQMQRPNLRSTASTRVALVGEQRPLFHNLNATTMLPQSSRPVEAVGRGNLHMALMLETLPATGILHVYCVYLFHQGRVSKTDLRNLSIKEVSPTLFCSINFSTNKVWRGIPPLPLCRTKFVERNCSFTPENTLWG